jgi:hypothetical protein
VNRIDFLISNSGHHVATLDPVVRHLCQAERVPYSIRYVSLCELRGMETPAELVRQEGVEVLRLFPTGVRRSPSTGTQSGRRSRIARRLARQVLSRAYLKRRIQRWLGDPPRLVVLPNDVAYPYDIICGFLRQRSIPFVLVQEGIRFPLPAEKDDARYGSGGARRVAVWGEASRGYFRSAGVNEARLRLTGCPRFDQIAEADWEECRISVRRRFGIEGPVVTLLTNPIDDQGYCTTAEKLSMVAGFFHRTLPVLESEGATLVLKPHARESAREYAEAIGESRIGRRVRVVEHEPIYSILAASDAAVTLASTAGLEALLFGLPLGVLEIPGAGYVHDYVSSGAAWGLGSNGANGEHIAEMLRTPHAKGAATQAYVGRQIARRTGAAGNVASVVTEALSYADTRES